MVPFFAPLDRKRGYPATWSHARFVAFAYPDAEGTLGFA